MHVNLSFSIWNIHGITNNVLGDKTKNQYFADNIKNLDIDVPGFTSFVSDTAIPHTYIVKYVAKSGGITLLVKTSLQNLFQLRKKLRISYGVNYLKKC